jgi:signal transduction histidine kinase
MAEWSNAAGAKSAVVKQEGRAEPARVVVISDDREFVDLLVCNWQRMRYSPEYSVCSVAAGGWLGGCAVAVADGLPALARLQPELALAIVVSDESLPERCEGTRLVRVARTSAWAEQAAMLAQESVLRLEAQAQVAQMKQLMRANERYAKLGRFIVEARHSLGNALTGVLGHCELMLLETEEELQGKLRSQLETIRSMSLKMHETFHRFSMLDQELRSAEEQPEWEAERKVPQSEGTSIRGAACQRKS